MIVHPAVEVVLNKFKVRDYQRNFFKAYLSGKYKKMVLCGHRRMGKDLLAWNIMLYEAMRKPGVYKYCLPTYSQARDVIWSSMTIDAVRFVDFFPPEVVAKRNEQKMSITLINGSIIQLVGSDAYDRSLVGTNARMIIWSEYSRANPESYTYARPQLAAQDGIAIFISTPLGQQNHFYQLCEIAKNDPENWYYERLTVDDTHCVPEEILEQERAEMSPQMYAQEYLCSFEFGTDQSYYGHQVNQMYLNNQIGDVPYDPGHLVHTAHDLGFNDPYVILFFQCIGSTIRIFDMYMDNKKPLDHIARVMKEKPYAYGKHIGPHDLFQHDLSTGNTRWSTMNDLGITFVQANELTVPRTVTDGIELVRKTLPRIWIDKNKCAKLVAALENYQEDYDDMKKIWKGKPLHSIHSHPADALRYLCGSVGLTKKGMSQEELDRRHAQQKLDANPYSIGVNRTWMNQR